MTVRQIYVNGKLIDVTGAGYEPKGEFLESGVSVNLKENGEFALLLKAGMLCTNANYDGKRVVGDTTEGVLIVAAAKAGIDKKVLGRLIHVSMRCHFYLKENL